MNKTPDEIKRNIITCMELNMEKFMPGATQKSLADALACIQQLEADNAQQARCIENLTDKLNATNDALPRWISVEERLPEDDANVLVYAIDNNENSCIAMTSYTHNLHGFHIEGWSSPWQYFFYEHTITHWMPLPSTEGLHDN